MSPRSVLKTTFVNDQPVSFVFHSYWLEVLAGEAAGARVLVESPRATLGSDPDCTVCLPDSGVSRRHALLEIHPQGLRLTDAQSRNGTFLAGRRVGEVYLEDRDVFHLASFPVRLSFASEQVEVQLSSSLRFGELVGHSRPMRELFALMEKVAPSAATVLVQGETGTGKELVAEALHQRSGRTGPLVVFDCSSVSASLIESELFGHAKGAFTGAEQERLGAFRAASGGTLFLDELGELPESLQPKLLRALEKREVKPVGADTTVPIDVRIVAATHRSLDREVKEGRFRSDLFHRLSVVTLNLPPLRDRLEDLPFLLESFLGEDSAKQVSYQTLQQLQRHPWPGNVRELKNFVLKAQAVAGGNLSLLAPPTTTSAMSPAATQLPSDVPYKQAKQTLVDEFERTYWTALLERCRHNLSEAARVAQIHRKSAEYIVQKLGLRAGGSR